MALAKTPSKLAWHSDSDDDVDHPKAAAGSSSRFNRVVVLKGMFRPQDLEDDPALLLELKEDVREEAESLGVVTSVILYDVRGDNDVELTLAEGRRGCDDSKVQGARCSSSLCAEDEWSLL